METHFLIYGAAMTAVLGGVLFYFFKKDSQTKSQNQASVTIKPKEGFAGKLKSILSQNKTIDDVVPELEETLITADTGVAVTEKLIQKLYHEKAQVQSSDQAYGFLKTEISKLLTPKSELHFDTAYKPVVIYLVGVNGVGKTTTIGKLAKQFKSKGKNTMLVAADTFRAAAVDQLRVWSEKNDVTFHGGSENADPSSVIVDGLRSAQSKNIDIVLVDTAGRLHTKTNLVEELKKMTRMSEKVLNKNPDEVFLVIDAMTGQNGFQQAKVFLEAVNVSGLILTKYDSTSKGGVILSIVEETGLPVRYIGLGEGVDDLKKFDPQDFVNKVFGESNHNSKAA